MFYRQVVFVSYNLELGCGLMFILKGFRDLRDQEGPVCQYSLTFGLANKPFCADFRVEFRVDETL